jgi:retron-type reverse transcriptase
VLKLIDRYLKGGALRAEGFEAMPEGTPQGGPLSPLLANLLLDGLDKELVNRGVSPDLAWNTCKSAHGPWRLSRSPALVFALPGAYFDALGVQRLYQRH